MRSAYSRRPFNLNKVLSKLKTLPISGASFIGETLRTLRNAAKLHQAANKKGKQGRPTYQEMVRKRFINNDKISNLQLGSLKLISTFQSLGQDQDQFKQKKEVKVNKRLLKGSISRRKSKYAIMKGNVKLAQVDSEREKKSKLNHIFEIPQFTPASVNNILYLLNNLNFNFNQNPVAAKHAQQSRKIKKNFTLKKLQRSNSFFNYVLFSDRFLINKIKLILVMIKQNQLN